MGLKSVDKKPKEINMRADIFELDYVIKWVDLNINKTKSSNSSVSTDKDGLDLSKVEFNMEDLEKMQKIYSKGNSNEKRGLLLRLPQMILDNFKKIEDIVEKEAKNKEYDSKYALVDKVKIGQQELARMFISFLKTSMPVLSQELENKSQNDIYHALDKHNKKEIDKLIKYIGTKEENEITFDEVIKVIIEAVVERNIEQKDLIQKIKAIK